MDVHASAQSYTPTGATMQQQPFTSLPPGTRIPYTEHFCPREPQGITEFEAQPPIHQAWLTVANTSISKLASSSHCWRHEHLSVPWPWLLHDLLRLLPDTSCYTVLLEDSSLFSRCLQQMVVPDSQALSAAGAQLLAQVVTEAADTVPASVVSYAETNDAILQRLKQICTELQSTHQLGEHQMTAQAYALKLANSFLAVSGTNKQEQRHSLKNAVTIISLLPAQTHAAVHLQLLLPHPDMAQHYLHSKQLPQHTELAHYHLATSLLDRFLTSIKSLPDFSAFQISRWTVWTLQPAHYSAQPRLQVRAAQLAYFASRFIKHKTCKNTSSRTHQPIVSFIEHVQNSFHPHNLQARINCWECDKNDAYIASLVKFVALLFGNIQLHHPGREAWCYRGQLGQDLNATAAFVTHSSVDATLLKGMQTAIRQLEQETHNTCLSPKQNVPAILPKALEQQHSHSSHKLEDPQAHATKSAPSAPPQGKLHFHRYD